MRRADLLGPAGCSHGPFGRHTGLPMLTCLSGPLTSALQSPAAREAMLPRPLSGDQRGTLRFGPYREWVASLETPLSRNARAWPLPTEAQTHWPQGLLVWEPREMGTRCTEHQTGMEEAWGQAPGDFGRFTSVRGTRGHPGPFGPDTAHPLQEPADTPTPASPRAAGFRDHASPSQGLTNT